MRTENLPNALRVVAKLLRSHGYQTSALINIDSAAEIERLRERLADATRQLEHMDTYVAELEHHLNPRPC